jgi:hypothetical protein
VEVVVKFVNFYVCLEVDLHQKLLQQLLLDCIGLNFRSLSLHKIAVDQFF